MNLFPWTAFLPEGFENGIIQKVLDRRLYGVGQHFTFWRFSRKWKFFGNFDCDFRKCFTKGFFLTENEVFRNFSFDGEFSIFTDSRSQATKLLPPDACLSSHFMVQLKPLFCCLGKINWNSYHFLCTLRCLTEELQLWSPLYFQRVCLLFFCTPRPLPSPPVNIAGIWILKFLFVSFENEGWRINFFICTFKPERSKFCWLFWRRIQKSLILRGWDVDEEWNVPNWWFQHNKIPIILKLIIVPRIEFCTESKKKK